MLEKNVFVYQVFVDFHQSYNFTYMNTLFNILYEFVAQDKLFRLVRAKFSVIQIV